MPRTLPYFVAARIFPAWLALGSAAPPPLRSIATTGIPDILSPPRTRRQSDKTAVSSYFTISPSGRQRKPGAVCARTVLNGKGQRYILQSGTCPPSLWFRAFIKFRPMPRLSQSFLFSRAEACSLRDTRAPRRICCCAAIPTNDAFPIIEDSPFHPHLRPSTSRLHDDTAPSSFISCELF